MSVDLRIVCRGCGSTDHDHHGCPNLIEVFVSADPQDRTVQVRFIDDGERKTARVAVDNVPILTRLVKQAAHVKLRQA